MTNYIGLINAMLRKREQDIEYQLAQEKMQAQGMQQLGSGIGDMLSNFTSQMQTGRQDQMANQLMNQEMPPAATAVDPAMQAMFTGQAGSPHTGGMSEFKMQLDMDQMRQDRMRTLASQQRVTALEEQKKAAEIAKFESKESKKMRDSFNDSMSYNTKMGDIMSKLGKAEDPEAYSQLSKVAQSVYQSGKAAGLDVQPVDIPPYMSAEDKAALATQRTAVEAAHTGMTEAMNSPETTTLHPIWGSAEPDPRRDIAIKAAQEKYALEKKTLSEMPGGIPRATLPESTAAASGGNVAPEGTRVTNAEGKTMIKKGGKWVAE